jgi:hypothetical protein
MIRHRHFRYQIKILPFAAWDLVHYDVARS